MLYIYTTYSIGESLQLPNTSKYRPSRISVTIYSISYTRYHIIIYSRTVSNVMINMNTYFVLLFNI